MPIQNGKYINPGWVNNASPAINAAELNAMSDALSEVYPRSATITVTTLNANESVTATLGSETYTLTSDASKKAIFTITTLGDWSITNNGITNIVHAYSYGIYAITFDTNATVGVASPALVVTGTYVGDGISSRTIVFPFLPKVVFMSARNMTEGIYIYPIAEDLVTSVTRVFWEGNSINFAAYSTSREAPYNHIGTQYYYVAIG